MIIYGEIVQHQGDNRSVITQVVIEAILQFGADAAVPLELRYFISTFSRNEPRPIVYFVTFGSIKKAVICSSGILASKWNASKGQYRMVIRWLREN